MSLRISRPGRVSIDGLTPPTPQQPLARRSPAHDFVGQQHAAHLGVLVLAFVHDGLAEYKQKREGITGRCGAGARAAGAPGRVQRPGTVARVATMPGHRGDPRPRAIVHSQRFGRPREPPECGAWEPET